MLSSCSEAKDLCIARATSTPPAFRFVVVAGIKLDSSECLQDAKLLAAQHILDERGGDCVFLGLVVAEATGFVDQVVVEGEFGSPVWIVT